MISPDQADLGVKAIFVWAGLLVPTIILLFLYYPEVSQMWSTLVVRPDSSDLRPNIHRAG